MNRFFVVLACAAMLFTVQPAVASDDVASELAEMRDLVNGLQQKVDAQEEQLVHQGQLIEQAQDVARTQRGEGTKSGLDDFLDSVSVGGHASGSWFFNFDDPSGDSGGAGLNQGLLGTMPFHPDHNTFTVDQVWFSLAKGATEESRGGFGFDIFYGNNANGLGQGTGLENDHDFDDGRLDNIDFDDSESLSRRGGAFDSTSDYYVAQAYVEYQCGCLGPEVNFKLGKWQTLVGAEVVQSGHNMNITVGNVYGLLQPVDHLGLLGTTDLGGMAEFSLGIMNSGGSMISSPDVNKEKSYLASLLVGDEKMNARLTFIYGADPLLFDDLEDYDGSSPGINSKRTGTVDLTAWLHPTDSLSAWANVTYVYTEGSDFSGLGVALAGRAQVTDKLGFALRGEYINLDDPANGTIDGEFIDDFTGSTPDSEGGGSHPHDFTAEGEYWGITATGDVALTDHLTARAEVRFDWFNEMGQSGHGYFENSNGEADNQTVAGVEVVYTF